MVLAEACANVPLDWPTAVVLSVALLTSFGFFAAVLLRRR
jgi:hypothetical protein